MSCLPRLSPGMLRHHTYMRTSFSGTWVAAGLLESYSAWFWSCHSWRLASMSAAIFIKRIISWKKNCFDQKHHGACRARKSSIDAEWWGYDLPLTACADECCRSSSGCTADAKSWDGGDLGDPFFKTTYHKRYNDPSDGDCSKATTSSYRA